MPLNSNGPLLKVSGILTYAEARTALDCGANALGFVVGLTQRVEDQVGVNTAKDIIDRLPAGTNTVLVTHLLDIQRIAELAGFVGTRAIQMHGSVSAAELPDLRALVPDKTLLKAVHVTGDEAVEVARAYNSFADALLLDSMTDEKLGGTGQTHDWSISRRIVEEMHPLPVYLAGGLTPDNVAEAIRTVRPAGVDVNSGVEDPQGGKSREPMARFVVEARKAFEI